MRKTSGGFLVTQIKQIQDRVFNRLLAGAGIDAFNGAQGRILYVLWQEDNLPIAQVAARTRLARSTLTSMLDRMEQSGHLRRVVDPADRRQIRIVLTDSARAMDKEYNRVSERMNGLFYRDFADDEIAAFEGYLARVLANLTESEQPG